MGRVEQMMRRRGLNASGSLSAPANAASKAKVQALHEEQARKKETAPATYTAATSRGRSPWSAATPRAMSGTPSTGEAWTRAAPSQAKVPERTPAATAPVMEKGGWGRRSAQAAGGIYPSGRGRSALPETGYSPGRERASRQYVKPPGSYQTQKGTYRDTWAQGLTGTERRERRESVNRQLAALDRQAQQARVDLDTDALNRINDRKKKLRASIGEQTVGDRAGDTASGSFQSYGAGVVNAVGTAANAFNDPRDYRRQIQDAYEVLEAGGYHYGGQFYPLTDTARKNIQDRIRGLADKAWQLERPTSFANRAYRLADRMQDDGAKYIANAKEGLGAGGQLAVDVGVAGTQMGLDALTAAFTGGSALVPMAVRAFGGGAQEARQAGADLDRQLIYGLGSAALSVGTERISNIAGPFKKMFGKGAAETIAGRLVKRFGENGAVQLMQRLSRTAAGRIALSAIGEGGEELVEAILQPFLKRATYDPNAKFDAGEAGRDALVAFILGGLGGEVEAVGNAGVKTGQGRAETGAGAEVQAPAVVDPFLEGFMEGDTEPVQLRRSGAKEARQGTAAAEAGPIGPRPALDGTGGLSEVRGLPKGAERELYIAALQNGLPGDPVRPDPLGRDRTSGSCT